MRIFVGVQPSATFLEELRALQARLRNAGVEGRYLDPAYLHLTLAFIGEWPHNVTSCLPAVKEPFSITLSHIGVFQRAKVLWAGIAPSQQLADLAAEVRNQLKDAGIPFDPQDFNPHISLIRKPVMPDERLLDEIRPDQVAMTVRDVCLYQPEHREEGMAYTVIGRRREKEPGMKLCVKRYEALTKDELYALLKLRIAVFVVEQQCPYMELDDRDQKAVHVWLEDGNGIQAYLRVMDRGVESQHVSIGRVMAVKRRSGLGSQVLREGIRVARECFHGDVLYLEAQVYAKRFYERAGFIQASEEFMEDGIPHIKMILPAEEAGREFPET